MRVDHLIVKAVFIAALMAAVPLGTAQAQVAVTSATPSSAPQGTVALDVEIAGSGFDSSAQVEFLVSGTTDPGGITVKKVSVRGSKKLIATIDVADDASVADFDIQVTLSGDRKGKGITLFKVQAKVANANDPCLDPTLDFPAFIYAKQNSTEEEIFVADADGRCSRSVIVLKYGAGTASFSYPVAGTTNVGRIAWPNSILRSIDWLDFIVDAASRTISVGAVRSMSIGYPLDGIELSRDGTRAYFSPLPETPEDPVVVRVTNIEDASAPVDVYRGPTAHSSWLSLNEGESVLVIEEAYRHSSPEGTGQRWRVVKVNLPCIDSEGCRTVVAENGLTSSWLYPVIDNGGGTIAYSAYQDGSNNCWLIQYQDSNGSRLYEGTQPRYGTRLSWLDGKILASGYSPPSRRNRCGATDTIVKIDPATGSEVTLLRGYSPDAR